MREGLSSHFRVTDFRGCQESGGASSASIILARQTYWKSKGGSVSVCRRRSKSFISSRRRIAAREGCKREWEEFEQTLTAEDECSRLTTCVSVCFLRVDTYWDSWRWQTLLVLERALARGTGKPCGTSIFAAKLPSTGAFKK